MTCWKQLARVLAKGCYTRGFRGIEQDRQAGMGSSSSSRQKIFVSRERGPWGCDVKGPLGAGPCQFKDAQCNQKLQRRDAWPQPCGDPSREVESSGTGGTQRVVGTIFARQREREYGGGRCDVEAADGRELPKSERAYEPPQAALDSRCSS